MDSTEITERLDLIIKLLAKSILNEDAPQKEKIIQLSKMGFKPKEIANILDTTSGYVSKEVSIARKGGLL